MADNFWMGGEELVIVYRNGTHVVLSNWEDKPLYIGRYEACREYCLAYKAQYEESTIG